MPLTRRHFLQTSAAAAVALSVSTSRTQTAAGDAQSALDLSTSRSQTGPQPADGPPAGQQAPTLRGTATPRGLLVGSAVDTHALRTDPVYAGLIATECSILVPENAMKFGLLRPTPDTFNFRDADLLVHFAEEHNILIRGHNFVWHRQLPDWFTGYATKQNAEAILIKHVQTVAGRYKGRMQSWDVCNEVIDVNDGLPGGLRNSPWYQLLGPGYIDLAFRTAREADPHALLCYNDYGIESESHGDAAKRAAVLELLRGMQQRGVPLDGLGIQSHISAGPKHTYGPGLTTFMKEVQGMGLKLFLTEMDVNDRDLPADPAVRDREVARTYKQYLDLTLSNPDVCALLTWGLTDKYTWLNGEDSRPDHQPERCLPFDKDYHPLPAFRAELDALAAAPARTLVRGRA